MADESDPSLQPVVSSSDATVESLRPSAYSSSTESEEESGGPIKSFLEHLEDLRWTFVKCVIAFVLSWLVCLSGANWIISVLKWPLDRAERIRTSPTPHVVLVLGTNVLARPLASAFPIEGLATNGDTILKIAPIQVGTNWVLGLSRDENPPSEAKRQTHVALKNYGPISGFNLLMQISLIGGLTLATPFILFFVSQFVLPALHMHEKKFFYKVTGTSILLFLLGVAFCYFLMLVITLSTTVGFSEWMGFGADEWRAEEYVSFVCYFMLGMGLAFQLPLVLLTLVKIGILSAKKLSDFRMYWFVAGLALAAFITPDGNPINMILLFLPLELLYEFSVIVAWFWERKARREESALPG